MRLITLFAVSLTLFAGCAVGQQIAYDTGQPSLRKGAPVPVALAVQDARPEVVSGKNSPDYVGFFRGGFGNKFDVRTTSGAPLAVDFAVVIGRGLKASGYRVTPVNACAKNAASPCLLVQLTEWKSDTYSNTALIYNVGAWVLDGHGQSLAHARLEGRDNLGGSFMNPPGHAKSAVPTAYLEVLERLLNDPKIIAALGPPTSVPAPAVPAETTVAPTSTAAPSPGPEPAAAHPR